MSTSILRRDDNGRSQVNSNFTCSSIQIHCFPFRLVTQYTVCMQDAIVYTPSFGTLETEMKCGEDLQSNRGARCGLVNKSVKRAVPQWELGSGHKVKEA